MGRLKEAEGQHLKALALDPTNAEIWINLGVDRFAAGETVRALTCFEQAVRLAPQNCTGYYDLARCELKMGRPKQARQHLEKALQLEPEHQAARTELALQQQRH
jgi:Flp pilus assembly protein TadD